MISQMWYHFTQGCRSIFSHRLMSFAAACMIVACLLIVGSFSLLAINIGNMLADLEAQNEFLAYIEDDLTLKQAEAVEADLRAIENISGVEFVTREQAMENFRADQKNPLYDDLDPEILRHRYRIYVHDLSMVSETVQQVEALDGVGDTRVAIEIADGFVTLKNAASGLALILGVTLVLISLFIISNTTRITTFTRKEEIAVMKMCGATDWFIRWPFIFEGVLLGLIGAAIAYFLQWGVYGVMQTGVESFTNLSFIYFVPFESISTWVLCVFLGAGFLIGSAGSVLTIRKFLRV